jgi:pSer/pThr/pTyr-binding forkhead associated (FHA) protein
VNEQSFPDGITLGELAPRLTKMDLAKVIGETPILVFKPLAGKGSPLFSTPAGDEEAEQTLLGDTTFADLSNQRSVFVDPEAVAVAVTVSNRSLDADEDKITIGRGRSNDIRLTSTLVSKDHATLTARHSGGQTQWQINDLGSANGTFVNGLRLEAQRANNLRPSDELGFADVKAVFLDAEALVNLCRLVAQQQGG